MKSLRKSVNSDKGRSNISTPLLLPNVSKPPSSIAPPQKVIRAQSAYRPQAPQELPFQKGDFFYVIKEVESNGSWYEAHNPVSGARGLVPRAKFEEFSKTPAPIRTGSASSVGSLSPGRPDSISPNSPMSPKTQVFYAVVLHDFVAERADELDAKAGDPISVVAQSNREWFVAKPIGRLGRPGLIPVSFVEVRNPATNQRITDLDALMDRGDLPKVEDWKKAMFSYKQNSIALGVIDEPSNRAGVPNSPYMPQTAYSSFAPPTPPQSVPQSVPQSAPPLQSGPPLAEPAIKVQAPSPQKQQYQQPPSPPPQRALSPISLPDGILLSANVVSFHFEMDEFWFRVNAIYQPFDRARPRNLPRAKQLCLFRVYNDFYDFQVSLLNTFPREAGRQPPSPRILPYMPGPADNVDQQITATRRVELDEYLHKLCELGLSGARFILEHRVVRDFLTPKPGDVDNDVDPRYEEMEALDEYDSSRRADDYRNGLDAIGEGDGYEGELREDLSQMRIAEEGERSEGSDYDDEGYGPSPQRTQDSHSYHPYSNNEPPPPNGHGLSLRQQAIAQQHQRTGSASSPYPRGPSPSQPRADSPGPGRAASPQYQASPRSATARSPLDMENRSSGYSRSSNSPRWPDNSASSPGSMRSTTASAAGAPPMNRSRSASNATSNLNNPPISAANPATAFVKIKVFDRVTDDLIALRVHPRIAHGELLEKVQARLGPEVAQLCYRDAANAPCALMGDDDLRQWMAETEKYVLYAE